MRVLILGFDDYAELDATMQKLIEESQCYLFYVLTSGGDGVSSQWAEKNGAPLYFLKQDATLDYIAWATDYIVLKLGPQTPQWHKNLMMKLKAAGKHGTVIRSD